MLTKYLIPALGAGALMITLAACDPSPTTPDAGEAPMTEAPIAGDTGIGDRGDFEEVPIPAGASGQTRPKLPLRYLAAPSQEKATSKNKLRSWQKPMLGRWCCSPKPASPMTQSTACATA